jgi:hypothetical protein
MTVLKTISEDQLDSLRTEVTEASTKLSEAIRSRMRLRRYELITFASTLALECTH